MAGLLFDGTPQGPDGPLGAESTYDPPWDDGAGPANAAGVSAKDVSRISIVRDGSCTDPFWRVECRPGDQFQTQSGERVLLVRPQHPFSFTEGGQLGDTRYYGVGVRLHSPFPAPNRYLLFLQNKQIPSASPTWSFTISKNSSAPEGSDKLQLFFDHRSGPCTNEQPVAGFNYRVGLPPFIDQAPTDEWLLLIAGVRYEREPIGWSTVWERLVTTPWRQIPQVQNEPTAMWDTKTGKPTSSYLSQGVYRHTDTKGTTHRLDLAGCYVAETLQAVQDRLEQAFPTSGRLNPRIVTDTTGSYCEYDRDPTTKGTYLFRNGVFATRTFDPGKTRIKLEKAGAPAPDPTSITVQPVDEIKLGAAEVAV